MIFAGDSVLREFGSTVLSMAGFAFATSASPGPVNIVSAMSGARFGAMRSFPYVFGATAGFIAILLLVGAGLGLFITRHPLVAKLLAMSGALYMLYLAYRIAHASADHMFDGDVATPPNVVAGIIAQIVNPKAWIVSLSAISIYVSTSKHYATVLVVFCVIFFVICMLSLWSWSLIGASLSKRLGGIRRFNLAMAALLTLSIIFFLYDVLR
ncbi:LysE family transporter [Aromatoleum toluclasticum]|uniref:LysE family translocator n=1 Tax=Aromatoleum toluclasticum TaxID=92003 RepID=UPI001D195D65|nr:LysE family transporter [Aromatoleum toluclasticum]MCC4113755.1 LysE family transporter [Aromatoleum toluclasticum]